MLNCFDLTGKVAVVTGAGKGLGRVFAEALGKSGAKLYLIGRNKALLEKAKSELEAQGIETQWFQADIKSEEQLSQALADCLNHYKKIDILVNNAASSRLNKSPEETSLSEWDEVINTNITGNFLVAKIFGQQMIKQKKGKIINIASMSGLIINKGVFGGSYETSKFGLIGLTKALAVEWAKHGINVNALAPGYFMTDPNREFFKNDPALLEEFTSNTPLQRIGDPKELEGVIVFLASEATSFMTGSIVTVDGGFTCW